MSQHDHDKPLSRIFDLEAGTAMPGQDGPENTSIVRSRIETGANPFRMWREHFRGDRRKVAAALEMDLRDYADIERNFFRCDRYEVDAFCRYFKLHPVDLINDTDVIPTGVAKSLADRTGNVWLMSPKRDRAREAIVQEIHKTEGVFAQARMAFKPGREPGEAEWPLTQVLARLDLSHPIAVSTTTYQSVRDVLLDAVDEESDKALAAKTALQDMKRTETRGQDVRLRQLLNLWSQLDTTDNAAAGYRIDRALKAKGMEFVRRDFEEDPDFYGINRWWPSKKVLIDGHSYDWGGACNAFFDVLGRWMAHNRIENMWETEQRLAEDRVRGLEIWVDQTLAQDMVQGFANMALFNAELPNDTVVQKALTPFRRESAAAAQKRVFNGYRPC